MPKTKKSKRTTGGPTRIRDTVYVVGAGFSKGLDYPLTNELLPEIWDRLEDKQRDQLHGIVKFHHPNFDPRKKRTFPDMERFMTEMQVNCLFDPPQPAAAPIPEERKAS